MIFILHGDVEGTRIMHDESTTRAYDIDSWINACANTLIRKALGHGSGMFSVLLQSSLIFFIHFLTEDVVMKV